MMLSELSDNQRIKKNFAYHNVVLARNALHCLRQKAARANRVQSTLKLAICLLFN